MEEFAVRDRQGYVLGSGEPWRAGGCAGLREVLRKVLFVSFNWTGSLEWFQSKWQLTRSIHCVVHFKKRLEPLAHKCNQADLHVVANKSQFPSLDQTLTHQDAEVCLRLLRAAETDRVTRAIRRMAVSISLPDDSPSCQVQ